MTQHPSRPFEPKRPTRKQVRAAAKRSRARSDAMSRDMAPPNLLQEIDPVPGQYK